MDYNHCHNRCKWFYDAKQASIVANDACLAPHQVFTLVLGYFIKLCHVYLSLEAENNGYALQDLRTFNNNTAEQHCYLQSQSDFQHLEV